jgi:hypothetical protein
MTEGDGAREVVDNFVERLRELSRVCWTVEAPG